MGYYEWGPHLDVHVGAMNDQHKGLIDAMNRLYDLLGQKASRAVLGQALDHLGKLTTSHFREEEAFMTRLNFPKLEMHKGLHKKLLDRFAEFATAFAKTGQLGEDFFQFLKFWLSAHIQGIDSQYAALVKK